MHSENPSKAPSLARVAPTPMVRRNRTALHRSETGRSSTTRRPTESESTPDSNTPATSGTSPTCAPSLRYTCPRVRRREARETTRICPTVAGWLNDAGTVRAAHTSADRVELEARCAWPEPEVEERVEGRQDVIALARPAKAAGPAATTLRIGRVLPGRAVLDLPRSARPTSGKARAAIRTLVPHPRIPSRLSRHLSYVNSTDPWILRYALSSIANAANSIASRRRTSTVWSWSRTGAPTGAACDPELRR